jgi:nucleoside-triphosphatase
MWSGDQIRLLLTGPPGVGKTTLVKRVVVKVRDVVRCSGFVTEEVRSGEGDRIGFDIVTLAGERAPLARKGLDRGPRVGDYRVDVRSIEEVAVPAMTEPWAQLLVVDEIGLMELKSEHFKAAMLRLLEEDRPLLGTIRLQREPFCDMVRSQPGVEVIEVSYMNRDGLVEMLAVRLIDQVVPQ